MTYNKYQILYENSESELDDYDRKLNNYDKKLNPIEQACVNNDLDYIVNLVNTCRLNKRKKNKFVKSLFESACNYSSFEIMEWLIKNYDKTIMNKYIVDNIDCYYVETNEQILKFFIEYDLDLDFEQSIFSCVKLKEIFMKSCEFGMLQLAKLMNENYLTISSIEKEDIIKCFKYSVSNLQFEIIEYLIDIVKNYNDNCEINHKKINNDEIHNLVTDEFKKYLNYIKIYVLHEIFDIIDKVSSEKIIKNFPSLIINLLLHIKINKLIDDESFKIILNKNIEKIINLDKKYLLSLVSNCNFQTLKYIFKLLDDYKYNNTKKLISEYLICLINIFTCQETFFEIINHFINKHAINESLEYKNIFKSCLPVYDTDTIQYLYNNGIKLFDLDFIIENLEKIITIRGFINKIKIEWLIKKINLDEIIYNFLNYNSYNDQTNTKILSIKQFDIIFKSLCLTNNLKYVKKIKNIMPDRYHYKTNTYNNIINYVIKESLIQSKIKQINWNKSNLHKCGICFSDNPNIITDCFHQYCKDCLIYWYDINKSCPYCKESLSTWTFLNIIDEHKNNIINNDNINILDSENNSNYDYYEISLFDIFNFGITHFHI